MTTIAQVNAALSAHARISDRFVFSVENTPRGVLVPSTTFAVTRGGAISAVIGPRGAAKHAPLRGARRSRAAWLFDALLATGAILPGRHEAVTAVAHLLRQPRHSRTVAWMATTVATCEGLVAQLERIRSGSVLFIGCGGIGSMAALALAGCGVRRFTLVDPDIIEESNLNRQLFWGRRDIGRPKVDVLAKRIRERFADTEVRACREKITLGQRVRTEADLVILTADRPAGIVRSCLAGLGAAKKSVITAGYFMDAIICELRIGPQRTRSERSRIEFLENGIMPSGAPINVELAGKVALMAVDYLRGRLTTSTMEHISCAGWPREKLR